MDKQEARGWTERELRTLMREEIKSEKASDPNRLVTLLDGRKVPFWVAMADRPTGDYVFHW